MYARIDTDGQFLQLHAVSTSVVCSKHREVRNRSTDARMRCSCAFSTRKMQSAAPTKGSQFWTLQRGSCNQSADAIQRRCPSRQRSGERASALVSNRYLLMLTGCITVYVPLSATFYQLSPSCRVDVNFFFAFRVLMSPSFKGRL